MSLAQGRIDEAELIDRIRTVIEAESRYSALSLDAKRIAIQTMLFSLEERLRVETNSQPAAEPSSA